VTTVGPNLTPSTISRFGSETCVIEIAWPNRSWPAERCPVSGEVAVVAPLLFVAGDR